MNSLVKASPERNERLNSLLYDWQGSAYRLIAASARKLSANVPVDEVDNWYPTQAIRLTRALYSLRPLAKELTVWSGLGVTANKVLSAMPCTATMALTAPLSTSKERDVAEDFVSLVDGTRYILEITIPAAARGAFLTGPEQELLLPPGTRIELTGDSYEYTVPQSKYGTGPCTYTVVKATVVGQRMPKWAR